MKKEFSRGVAQPGSAPASGVGSPGFKSPRPDQFNTEYTGIGYLVPRGLTWRSIFLYRAFGTDRYQIPAPRPVFKKLTVSAKIYVQGLVQGVAFRAFTEREARRLGLMGFCRNLGDGRVEVVLEGEKEAIESLVHRLHVGPSRAEVQEVQVHWGEAAGNMNSFEIRYV